MDRAALTANGFRLSDDPTEKHRDLALLSLRIGLKAYFSTYRAIGTFLKQLTNDAGEKTDHLYGRAYYEAYSEAVLHLQHFFELVYKQVLRDRHPLLADSPGRDSHVLLDALLQGQPASSLKFERLQSIEFSETLARLKALVKEKRLDARFQPYSDAVKWLEQLNWLRNRIWHRGTFVLRYQTLDELICRYVLPHVVYVMSQPEYAKARWKYEPLQCGVDPIDALIGAYAGSVSPDFRMVSYLKELGRAAYGNPLMEMSRRIAESPDQAGQTKGWSLKTFTEHLNTEKINRAVRIAAGEAGEHGEVRRVDGCPVCGVKALLVLEDMVVPDHEDDEDQNVYRYIFGVRCELCSFQVDAQLGDPSAVGLPQLPHYWMTEIV